MLQVGAGVSGGVMLQVKFTVPLNDATGATVKLNVALFPAAMVDEVDDPDATPTAKSGAGRPVPDRATVCGLPGAASLMEIPAVCDPAVTGANVTLTVQLPAAGKELPQVLVSVKSEPSAPVTSMLLMFSEALPVFTSRMPAAALLVPAVCGAKFNRLGYAAKKGPFTPVPLRGMASGLILVLSVTVMVPDSRPVAVGVKVTVTAQWAPIARLAPQSLVWLKFPVAAMLATLILTLLGLLIVTVWAALVLPTPWEPKFSEAGQI